MKVCMRRIKGLFSISVTVYLVGLVGGALAAIGFILQKDNRG